MPDSPSGTGPIDAEILDRIAAHLGRNDRFDEVEARPSYAPSAVVAKYDLGYFPGGVKRAALRIRWFETDDFSIHYTEQYRTGESWECRWERHPTEHNARDHVHPPPAAASPGDDADFADDWRAVLATALTQLDERIDAFWAEE